MANLRLTNDEIFRAIGQAVGIGRDPGEWNTAEAEDARAAARAGLRKFYHPSTPDGTIYQWKFLERQFTASGQAKYTTGTVVVTDGVVTLTDGTWPSWADDGLFRYGSRTYYVESRDTDSQITLKNSSLDVAAGASYELHRYRHPISSDFGDFIDGMVLRSSGVKAGMVGAADESEIRLRHETNFETGQPRRFAIQHGNDNDTSDWYILPWPLLGSGEILTSTYRKVPLDNLPADVTSTDTTVQIDAVHAETLLAAIMSSAEEYFLDMVDGPHGQRFFGRLAVSINHDMHSQGPVSFETPREVDERRYSLLYHDPTYEDLLP